MNPNDESVRRDPVLFCSIRSINAVGDMAGKGVRRDPVLFCSIRRRRLGWWRWIWLVSGVIRFSSARFAGGLKNSQPQWMQCPA